MALGPIRDVGWCRELSHYRGCGVALGPIGDVGWHWELCVTMGVALGALCPYRGHRVAPELCVPIGDVGWLWVL